MGGGGAELLCLAVCIPCTGPALLKGMDQLLPDPFAQSPPYAWADSSPAGVFGMPCPLLSSSCPIPVPQLFCQVPSSPRIPQEPGALKSTEEGHTSHLCWEDNEKGSQGWKGGWRPSCTPPAPLALTSSALSGNYCLARC